MLKLLLTIVSGTLGLWLADYFISGVEFTGSWQTLLLAGLTLGLINFFIKPILKLITLPIRLLTLGLFGLIINILLVWIIDIVFIELIIDGIIPLLWTTLIIWGLGVLMPAFFPKKKNKLIET
ncbi:MAG: phage holin family protein [Candidatus Nealsonbacteria bacterium]|nr:phage holin family protein [Candidatus Nealsonbacteria bacterium]